MPQTLLAISQDMMALDALLDEVGIDNEEAQAQLAKWSDELKSNMAEKVDNYCAFASTLVLRAKVRKDEAARLSKRAKTDENTAKKLKEFLKTTLDFHEITTIDTPRYKVTVAKAGGKQSVECLVKTAGELPEEFRTEVPASFKQNTDAIRAALDAGREVGGCRLLPRGTYLKIS